MKNGFRETLQFYLVDCKTPLGKIIDIFIVLLNLFICAILVIETYDLSGGARHVLHIMEMAIVFLLFIYPNPVATPLLLAMGAARFNLTKFTIICWSGKTVQGLILSYLGHFGLRSLLHFFGVFNIS